MTSIESLARASEVDGRLASLQAVAALLLRSANVARIGLLPRPGSGFGEFLRRDPQAAAIVDLLSDGVLDSSRDVRDQAVALIGYFPELLGLVERKLGFSLPGSVDVSPAREQELADAREYLQRASDFLERLASSSPR